MTLQANTVSAFGLFVGCRCNKAFIHGTRMTCCMSQDVALIAPPQDQAPEPTPYTWDTAENLHVTRGKTVSRMCISHIALRVNNVLHCTVCRKRQSGNNKNPRKKTVHLSVNLHSFYMNVRFTLRSCSVAWISNLRIITILSSTSNPHKRVDC